MLIFVEDNQSNPVFMKKLVIFLTLILSANMLVAQPGGHGFWGPQPETIQVWPDGAPNAFTYDASTDPQGENYKEAILEIYPARNPNGRCVIICPGGGYAVLSMTHEGRDIRQWLNARGFTCCLLQYRMPRGHHDVPLSDVQQAMRIMRGRTDLGITHIGVMGFSAGGHLASTASTHYVDAETRPDFQILVYPVITFEKPYTHDGSVFGLLGAEPSQEMLDLYSNQKQVTPDTPPAFILAASDDWLVPVKNSLMYYEALVENKVSATMHIYPTGGHGFGWGDNYIYKQEWSSELERWFNTVVLK
jgi:acetyl esterase/lipase